jgi:Fe-Mn family superoxide dismutase
MATSLAGGSGWVLLTWIPRDGRLVNQFATDHSQSIAGGIPILALDMYEHAFHIDFGANAKAYIEAFMRNLDWKSVEEALLQAAQVAPPPRSSSRSSRSPGRRARGGEGDDRRGQKVQIVDARPSFYASRTQDIMEGATWRDPDRVQDWIGELSKTEPVVVFCVYGFHVGCRTAGTLREAGFDAKFMKGGHVAWKAMGGKTKMFA